MPYREQGRNFYSAIWCQYVLTLETTQNFFPFWADLWIKAICHLCEHSLLSTCYWCQLTEEAVKCWWGWFSSVLTVLPAFPCRRDNFCAIDKWFLGLGCLWGTSQIGVHYFSRNLEWPQTFITRYFDALYWENCLFIEHSFCSSPLFEACSPIPFPASSCGGDNEKFYSCPIWLLSPPSGFLLNHCNAEVARELGVSLPWIHTSRGGSCIKYFVSNLWQNSLCFY